VYRVSIFFAVRASLVVAFAMTALAYAPTSAQGDPEVDGSPAAEDRPPSYVIYPVDGKDGDYVDLTAEPGSHHVVTVVLGNTSPTVETIYAFAADATTAVNGGMVAATADSERTDISTWIDFEPVTAELQPGEGVEHEFSVDVPENAAPGQYIAALVIQNSEPLPIEGNDVFTQTIRKAIAVFITVPGPVTASLEIGEPSFIERTDILMLVVPLNNSGNTLLKPSGTVSFLNDDGEAVASAPVALGSVYAGHQTTMEIALRDRLPVGDYQIEVHLEDTDKGWSIDQSLTASAPDPNATPEPPPPVSIQETLIEPVPSAEKIQYLNVTASIGNTGEPVANARLIFHVTRDGQAVEDFALASSLSLPSGATDVQQRYIPAAGWEPGVYAFALTLESVDPTNGVATVIEHLELAETVNVS
jgi:hypothetical protein